MYCFLREMLLFIPSTPAATTAGNIIADTAAPHLCLGFLQAQRHVCKQSFTVLQNGRRRHLKYTQRSTIVVQEQTSCVSWNMRCSTRCLYVVTETDIQRLIRAWFHFHVLVSRCCGFPISWSSRREQHGWGWCSGEADEKAFLEDWGSGIETGTQISFAVETDTTAPVRQECLCVREIERGECMSLMLQRRLCVCVCVVPGQLSQVYLCNFISCAFHSTDCTMIDYCIYNGHELLCLLLGSQSLIRLYNCAAVGEETAFRLMLYLTNPKLQHNSL